MPGADFFALTRAFAPEIDAHVHDAGTGPPTAANWCSRCRGRHPKTYEYLLVPVLDPQGRSEAVAGTARDITERKEVEDRIRRSANYDYLTDLPNRSLFRERLEHEVKHCGAQRAAAGAAVPRPGWIQGSQRQAGA